MTRLNNRSNPGTCAVTLASLAGGLALCLSSPAQALPDAPVSTAAGVTPLQPLLAEAPTLPADGVYLFGEQPVPDQLATAYFVFELQAGRVTGAFYMPQSSFDCVQGEMRDAEMALTITDSYSQEQYTYALALTQDALVASNDGVAALSLSGFHQIDQLSDTDQRLLSTCLANYSDMI